MFLTKYTVEAIFSGAPVTRVTGAVYSSKAVGEPPSLLAAGLPSAIRSAVNEYRKSQGLKEKTDLLTDIPMTAGKIIACCTVE